MNESGSLRWLVLALCLFSFAKGGSGLDTQSLWWDESLSHYRATNGSWGALLSNEMRFLSGTELVRITPDNHPPLYFVLLRGIVSVAGESEFALRYLSLASGVLLVAALYACGVRALGQTGGALAAAFGALSPLYLWAQQEARPYALGTLLATLSFYALLRTVQECAILGRNQPRSWRAWRRELCWPSLYLVLASAALLTHYQALLLLPAHGLIILLARCRDKRVLVGALLVVGLIAAGVGVWGLCTLPDQDAVPGYTFISLDVLLQDVFRSFPLGLVSGAAAPAAWLGVALLVTAAIVAAVHRQGSGRPILYLLLCALLPVVEIYGLSYVRPAYMNVRHLIFASPFYFLTLPAGLLGLEKKRWLRGAAGAALVALAAAMLWSGGLYRTAFVKEDHRSWGRYLDQHVRDDDLVVINPGAIFDLYFYYTDTQAQWIGLPALGADPEQTKARMAALAAEFDRIWVAQSLTPHWANPGDPVVAWLQEHGQPFARQRFASNTTTVQAYGFYTSSPIVDAAPEIDRTQALDFGPLRLLGVHVTQDGAPSGGTLQLRMFWSVQRQPGIDYRCTLSLVNEQGFSWSSLDYAPAGKELPTSAWPVGATIRDDVDLDVPTGVPPGEYRLNLSVYPADGSGPATRSALVATSSSRPAAASGAGRRLLARAWSAGSTRSTRSASPCARAARSIPARSEGAVASRAPAASQSSTSQPPNTSLLETRSRVVPGSAETRERP